MKHKVLTLLMLIGIGLFVLPVAAQDAVPAAYVRIDPPGNSINGSTYNNGSFVIRNDSTNGLRISKVTFDLSTAILPKMIFDPDGTGGDLVAKGFTPNSGQQATGLQNHAFTKPYNAQNQGFYGLEINFSNFDPGETFTFSVDVDPATTRGIPAPGPGESGSVSGLELAASTITVNFSNGSSYSGQLYRIPNTLDAAQNTIGTASSALAKPGLSVVGLNTPTITNTASQTLRVTGPAGASVAVMVMESALYTPICSGCTAAPFEANSAVAVKEVSGTVGSNGQVDLPVTLTRSNPSAGLNYMVAVVKGANGINGPTSNIVVVEYDPNAVVNRPPVANNDTFATDRDTTLTGNVLANDTDPDGDTLTAFVVTQPSHGSLNLNTNGNFTYQPNQGYVGTDSFIYQARDGRGGTANATVNITVRPVNDPPVAVDDNFTINRDETLTGNVLANDSDPNGDTLTAFVLTQPTHGTLNLSSNGNFTYQPSQGYIGADSFTYEARDGNGGTDSATVRITILGSANLPPVAVDDVYMTFEGVTLRINRNNGVLANDYDPDGLQSDLTATLLASPPGWVIALQPNGAFTLTPAEGFTGEDVFTYAVTDSQGASANGTVFISVQPRETDAELLSNGTFEDKSPAIPRNPAVWNGVLQNTDRLRCNRIDHPGGLPDRIFAHEGLCAFRFLGAPGKNSRIVQRVSTENLQAGDVVQFAGYLKANNLPANTARIIIRATYLNQPQQNRVIIPQAGTYQNYLQFTEQLQLTGQPTSLRVIVRFTAPRGALWLDMFSLRLLGQD